jgi:hypothetical protein
MSRCPVCHSVRIVVVLTPDRRSFCAQCGSRWIQEGSHQRSVERSAEREPIGLEVDQGKTGPLVG